MLFWAGRERLRQEINFRILTQISSGFCIFGILLRAAGCRKKAIKRLISVTLSFRELIKRDEIWLKFNMFIMTGSAAASPLTSVLYLYSTDCHGCCCCFTWYSDCSVSLSEVNFIGFAENVFCTAACRNLNASQSMYFEPLFTRTADTCRTDGSTNCREP